MLTLHTHQMLYHGVMCHFRHDMMLILYTHQMLYHGVMCHSRHDMMLILYTHQMLYHGAMCHFRHDMMLTLYTHQMLYHGAMCHSRHDMMLILYTHQMLYHGAMCHSRHDMMLILYTQWILYYGAMLLCDMVLTFGGGWALTQQMSLNSDPAWMTRGRRSKLNWGGSSSMGFSNWISSNSFFLQTTHRDRELQLLAILRTDNNNYIFMFNDAQSNDKHIKGNDYTSVTYCNKD